jgi:hypothetical protein
VPERSKDGAGCWRCASKPERLWQTKPSSVFQMMPAHLSVAYSIPCQGEVGEGRGKGNSTVGTPATHSVARTGSGHYDRHFGKRPRIKANTRSAIVRNKFKFNVCVSILWARACKTLVSNIFFRKR